MALNWQVCKVRWRRRGKVRTSIVEALSTGHARQIIKRRAGVGRKVTVLYCKPAAPLAGARGRGRR